MPSVLMVQNQFKNTMAIAEQQIFLEEIESNRGIIYRICKLYEYDTVLQEDLFQEIILQAWKAYKRFRGDSKFSTWLYRVALNTAITYLKKYKRRVEKNSVSISTTILQIKEEENEVEKEQLESLYKAIAQLNKIEKALVILYLEDKSYEEMSEILGISISNVGAKLSRVRNSLRKRLNPILS